jgi:hypothetical protein
LRNNGWLRIIMAWRICLRVISIFAIFMLKILITFKIRFKCNYTHMSADHGILAFKLISLYSMILVFKVLKAFL